MKTRITIILNLLLITLHCSALPVIINDTEKWGGYCWAKEKGFYTFNEGSWIQIGANNNTENIWNIWDDYEPKISGSGVNSIWARYWGIKHISGLNMDYKIQVKTAPLIINEITHWTQKRGHLVSLENLIGPCPASAYPADGHLDEGNISVQIANNHFATTADIICGIGIVLSMPGTSKVLAILGGPWAAAAGKITAVLAGPTSLIIQKHSVISEIVYSTKYENLYLYYQMQGHPDWTWVYKGQVTADIVQYQFLGYDDSNGDGFVHDELQTRDDYYKPNFSNIRQSYELQIIP
jgi:hypothetical protein